MVFIRHDTGGLNQRGGENPDRFIYANGDHDDICTWLLGRRQPFESYLKIWVEFEGRLCFSPVLHRFRDWIHGLALQLKSCSSSLSELNCIWVLKGICVQLKILKRNNPVLGLKLNSDSTGTENILSSGAFNSNPVQTYIWLWHSNPIQPFNSSVAFLLKCTSLFQLRFSHRTQSFSHATLKLKCDSNSDPLNQTQAFRLKEIRFSVLGGNIFLSRAFSSNAIHLQRIWLKSLFRSDSNVVKRLDSGTFSHWDFNSNTIQLFLNSNKFSDNEYWFSKMILELDFSCLAFQLKYNWTL